MIRRILDSLVDRTIDLRAEHFDSLRSFCGRNEDFFENCMALASEIERLKHGATVDSTFGANLFDRVNSDITARLRSGRATGPEAVKLLYIAQCVLYGDTDNETLNAIVRWNELSLLHSDSFFLALVPDCDFGVGITQVSRSQWKIEMKYGFRSAIGEAVVLYWESLNGRCTVNPAAHLSENMRRILTGQSRLQYPGVSTEHVSQTDKLAYLVKLFVFSHEIGHVIAHRDRMTFKPQCEEEFFADKMGQYLYLPAALMMMPPFDKLVASGEIRNSTERRQRMLSDPRILEGIQRMATGRELEKNTLPKSGLYKNEDDEQHAAFWNGLIWAIPILVFRLIECYERELKAVGQSPAATHPPARERIKSFWDGQPDTRLRKWFESTVAPTIDPLFS